MKEKQIDVVCNSTKSKLYLVEIITLIRMYISSIHYKNIDTTISIRRSENGEASVEINQTQKERI